MLATTLNIKPVMGAEMGNIIQLSQSIGFKKALKKMVEILCKEVCDPINKRVVITHCNAIEKAEALKAELLSHLRVRELQILDMAGVSSLYANDGGIIVTI